MLTDSLHSNPRDKTEIGKIWKDTDSVKVASRVCAGLGTKRRGVRRGGGACARGGAGRVPSSRLELKLGNDG